MATESKNAEEGGADPEFCRPGQRQFATTTVGAVLSVKELVVWRGLAFLIMILILVGGVIISNLLVGF